MNWLNCREIENDRNNKRGSVVNDKAKRDRVETEWKIFTSSPTASPKVSPNLLAEMILTMDKLLPYIPNTVLWLGYIMRYCAAI